MTLEEFWEALVDGHQSIFQDDLHRRNSLCLAQRGSAKRTVILEPTAWRNPRSRKIWLLICTLFDVGSILTWAPKYRDPTP